MINLMTLPLLSLVAVTGLTTPAPDPATAEEDIPDASLIRGLPRAPMDRDYHDDGQPSKEKVALGRLLFFDKILSGNRNIACATCHHPDHASSDGVALSFGEGARGLAADRRPGPNKHEAVHGRIPRNSPALFNLGAREFTRLFHDGRVETDAEGHYESGFISPARWKLPMGLDSPLAAQALFPVLSAGEMAGQKGENPIADAVSLNRAAGPGGAWDLLAQRLRAIPEYRTRFREAFPGIVRQPEDITMVQVGNASAAFESRAFRADNSPFDQFLRGNTKAMPLASRRGMKLFYGKARCADCHQGAFQTDHDFHAIAMPQIGPGKGDGQDASYWQASGHRGFVEDFGRGRVTGRSEDNYKFRTPSLRNVALTGPWGHAGAYDSLEAVVRHHLAPARQLAVYHPSPEMLPPMGSVLELTARHATLSQDWVQGQRLDGFHLRDTWVARQAALRDRIAEANELQPVGLTDSEVHDLVAFLESLSDPVSNREVRRVPDRVPSGLPVQD